jgi:hypothetical protein
MVAILFPCFIAVAEAQTRGKSGGSEVGIIIGVIVGVIVLFLACRELICWYYKINRIVALMEKQNLLLESLLRNKTQTPSSSGTNISNVPPIPSVVNTGDSWVCKKCSERNPNTATSCKGCGAYK